ncbi:MAG: polyprenyl synthetase family protein [Candidatus Aminicenantales bacterium]
MTQPVETRLQEMKAALEDYMKEILGKEESALFAAMRYAVFSEGKRFRPLLLLASGESFGAKRDLLLPFACAIEFIHNYSLIHDDLPSMDNDDFRRGRPSCHRAFGEDVALLAGDGLLTLAFEIMLQAPVPETLMERKVEAIWEISRQAGPRGMIAGQFMDINLKPEIIREEELVELMQKKTGALITASVKTGALLAAASERDVRLMEKFGRRLGLAFQIRDDLLDVDEPGKKASYRPNYVRVVNRERAREGLKKLVGEAIEMLEVANRLTEELNYLSLKLLDVA